MQFNELNLFYQNVRGLRTKLLPFRLGVIASSYQIYAITETWLNESVSSSELFTDEFIVYRRDRSGSGTKGGGVMLAVKNCLKSCRLTDLETEGENIWLRVTFSKNFSVVLGLVYFPPNSPLQLYNLFFESLEQFNFTNEKILILGDFNLQITGPTFNLTDGGSICKQLCFFKEMFSLELKNNVSNFQGKTLDLVLSDISDLKVYEEAHFVSLDRYHPPLGIVFEIPVKNCAQNKITDRSRSVSYNFKKGNYFELYNSLMCTDWSYLLNNQNIDECVKLFYRLLYSKLDLHIPVKRSFKNKYPIWFSYNTKKSIRRKEIARRKYKKYHTEFYLNEYKILRSESKYLIKQDYLKYTMQLEDNVTNNPLSFWSVVKRLRSNQCRVASMVLDGVEVEGGGAIAEAFAAYFQSVYEPSTLDCDQLTQRALDSPARTLTAGCLTLDFVTEDELSLAIKRLKSKKSSGPDGIPSFIFKGCSEFLIKPLLHLFNLSIKSSIFPDYWKLTKVVPIFKKGQRNDIKNHRPVAILSTPAKIFESILYNRLFRHVKSSISPFQHGFFPNRSINTNLLQFSDFCISSIDKGGQVDVIYTDFSKAFDKVNHLQLLKKLNYFGLSVGGIKFFSSYLHNRRQVVDFNGFSSRQFHVQSGVPQGSNLGPLLFIIYIDDIVQCVKNSKVLLYADDMKIFRQINSFDDCRLLQEDLDRLVVWSDSGLKFNSDKCVVVRYSRKTRNLLNFSYRMGNTILSVCSSIRDLGVLFDEKFLFSGHIVEICKVAYRNLGFLCRSGSFLKNIDSFKLLYCSLVRSRLEFGNIVWYPYQNYLYDLIEKIQVKFLRFLYFKLMGVYSFTVPYSALLLIFGMERLSRRRDVGMLVFLHKLANGVIDDSELLSRLCFLVPRRTSRVQRLFAPHFGHSNLGAQSPINVMMRLYNALPDNVDIFASALASFKRSLN
jgi:hypothetical protein